MKERGYIEKLWREEKYHILFHSQYYYEEIRQLLKDSPSLEEVQHMIDKGLREEPTKGSIINTYDHMWGYFKKKATSSEKAHSLSLKEYFINDNISSTELLNFLKTLADKYKVTYLQQSTILRNQKNKGPKARQ
ncbi:type II DNA modification enzyme [Staphylococcus devriesei]|uniref:Type II DNA modification enzyme n=1 Tax=Staphylococcus devriesei TaxID=586733 RepID=A0A2T4KYZ2_9STAP|nr:YbgA family protein [Staphylococcus devriesei]PTF03262.1 type II DNA modification enzyme [Staphylococcus devriesei]PTF14792.1 type II DNA modification enzyme [Staphylococcus devriesei]